MNRVGAQEGRLAGSGDILDAVDEDGLLLGVLVVAERQVVPFAGLQRGRAGGVVAGTVEAHIRYAVAHHQVQSFAV